MTLIKLIRNMSDAALFLGLIMWIEAQNALWIVMLINHAAYMITKFYAKFGVHVAWVSLKQISNTSQFNFLFKLLWQ